MIIVADGLLTLELTVGVEGARQARAQIVLVGNFVGQLAVFVETLA